MSDTGTDWAAEADEADEWAERLEHLHAVGMGTGSRSLRLWAVGLRRLAQLDTASGDPGNLRLLADTFDLPILRRIADAAVLGSGEQPERTEP